MAGTLRGIVGLLLATALLPTSFGCIGGWARHGLLLRGDWSLEVNRTPWLADRSVIHEDVSEGCEVSECGPAAAPACAPACAPASSGACIRPGGGSGRLRGMPSNDAAMAQANYHNHPRFHPVPTQPVFLSRGNANPPVDPAVTPASDVEVPAPASPIPAPMPTPTVQPESLPAPTGEATGAWRSRSSSSTSAGAVPQSWVFAPAEETLASEPVAMPARQVSLSKSSQSLSPRTKVAR